MESTREPSPVQIMIVEVGRDLSQAFTGVLNAIPGGPHRPQWLARTLGVNTVLTSRLLKAAQQRDPLAVAHIIPGPEPLRRLLRAAERKKVDLALIREARLAVDRFQHLIDTEAGDRSALDAMISGWLPDARQKVELIAKQSVFRGMSQLLGVACEMEHYTIVVYPSAPDHGRATSDVADQACIGVTRGLRRLRPGLVVKYDTVHSTGPLLTVDEEPVEGLHGVLLEQFCSTPLPQLHVSRFGDRAQYTLSGESVGMRSGVDLAHATLLLRKKELMAEATPSGQPPRKATMSIGITLPSRTFIFDVLLHTDVYPGRQPALHVYRAMPYGAATPNDPSRDVDRLDIIQSIQPLGQGITKFRAAENPTHIDMLSYICERRRWDGDQLRGFRCRIEYPINNSEIVMAFDMPRK
jgi:hypothetical protein